MSKHLCLSRFSRWTLSGVVTLLASVTALGMGAAQFEYARHPEEPCGFMSQDVYYRLSLWKLSELADELKGMTDLAQRDERCNPISGLARRMDEKLPRDARIFVTGVLGERNAYRTGIYFFLRHHLFPRDMEISLDGQAVQTLDGFQGVSSDSPEELRAHGFDILIQLGGKQGAEVSFLTEKGVPK